LAAGEPGVGTAAVATCRPERLELSLDRPDSENCWAGSVIRSVYLGSHIEHLVRVGELELRIGRHDGRPLAPGTEVWVSAEAQCVRVLDTDAATESEGGPDVHPT